MLCPYCQHPETKVNESRETESLESTRRRRECLKCEKRFTTYERIETDLRIVKKDGRIEQYNREKLKNGMLKACEKRPVTSEMIESSIQRIESKLRSKQTTDIKSSVVGEIMMNELKKLDNVAYIRFASVYRDFEDVNDFKKEINKITK